MYTTFGCIVGTEAARGLVLTLPGLCSVFCTAYTALGVSSLIGLPEASYGIATAGAFNIWDDLL